MCVSLCGYSVALQTHIVQVTSGVFYPWQCHRDKEVSQRERPTWAVVSLTRNPSHCFHFVPLAFSLLWYRRGSFILRFYSANITFRQFLPPSSYLPFLPLTLLTVFNGVYYSRPIKGQSTHHSRCHEQRERYAFTSRCQYETETNGWYALCVVLKKLSAFTLNGLYHAWFDLCRIFPVEIQFVFVIIVDGCFLVTC